MSDRLVGRAPRALQDVMAYPYFALSKKKRVEPLSFTTSDGTVSLTVESLQRVGIASIYDADILLWLCTEMRRHYEKTGEVRRTVTFNPRTMLKQLGRSKGGRQIQTLKNALIRLATTFITTTIRTEHQKREGGFHWIDNWETVTTPDDAEATADWSVTLNDWVVAGVLQDKNLLTLSGDYYRLASGLKKRLYLIARKHAGHQAFGWTFTMAQLYEKSGTSDRPREFAYGVRQIARFEGALLDYTITVTEDDGVEKVWFRHVKFGNSQKPGVVAESGR